MAKGVQVQNIGNTWEGRELMRCWIDPKTASFRRAAKTAFLKRESPHASPKDKRRALESVGFNWRLTHNRLFAGRSAAAT
jgi:hypothetical protein